MKPTKLVLLIALVLISFELNAMPLSPESIEHLKASGQLEQVLQRFAEAQSRGIDYPGVNILDNLRSLHRDNPADIEIRLPVILVDFSDNIADAEENTAELYTQQFFSIDELDPGSLREWYLENSYNEVAVIGEVVGWIRLERTYEYYVAGQYGIGDYPRNSAGMTRDAVIAADNRINFSQYDNDGDGVVDTVVLVHAGSSAEDNNGDEDMIWSHCSSLGGQAVRLDGVWIRTFVTVPEYSTLGVTSHELGHGLFDLPDLYDRDGSSEGLGDWSVMAGGSWNGNGTSPAHFDAWSKMQLGFIEPVVLQENLDNVQIPPIETEGAAYILWDRGRARSEYFLIENRQRIGFDAALPGQGLLVYHIDDNMIESENDNEWYPGNEDEGHYLVALEQADGDWELEQTNSRGDSSDPFPGAQRNTTFDSESVPSSRAYSGAITNVAITDIVIQNRIATCGLRIMPGNDDPGTLCINEFQADNDGTVQDPAGEFEDWVEVYNGTDEEIDLAGYTMSDMLDNPGMWEFPDGVTIRAGGFLVVWADRDMEQEGVHSSFTLNQRGEVVGLWAPNGDEIDFVEYGEQQADWSFGREEDGSNNWIEIENPTPGRSNAGGGGGGEPGEDIIAYDDGEPATLYISENYWSRVIFTPESDFDLQGVSLMPLNAGPNPNAPCHIRVYSENQQTNNLDELLWEGTIQQLAEFNFDDMPGNWYNLELDEPINFGAGENFSIMYGPAPGGEYLPGEQGAGWWNLTDDGSESGRSFMAIGANPPEVHADWENIADGDLFIRANGAAGDVVPPAIEVDPLAIEGVNGGEHVINIANVGDGVLRWDSELEIIGEPERDRGSRGVRGVGPVRGIEVPSSETEQAVKHGFASQAQIDEVNNYRVAVQEDAARPRRDERGDPDDAGYYWLDSAEDDGPEYQWVDISQVGQRLQATDDWNSGWIQLGFDFPWYDQAFNQLRICSNGFITFDNFAEAPFDVLPPPPNAAAPNNLFLVNNADWDPTAGGAMYFWTNREDLAVVSWVNIPPWGDDEVRTTFQAIFSGLGIVLYQFGPQQGVDGSFSAVGYENGNGQLGATIVYGDEGRLAEGLSIAIGRDLPSTWISYDPTRGELAPGQETEIFVVLDSEGLQAGIYEADLHILSNDEENPDVTVNIVMEVDGAPAIAIDPDVVNFGRVGVGRVRNADFTVRNVGNDLLVVEEILIEGDYFSMDFEDAIDVAVGDEVDITVSFEPEEVGDFEGLVTILSNDPNNDAAEVGLVGSGVEGGGEPGEDVIGYDDSEPNTLFITENYWSKVIFTAPEPFELQSIVFMPLNAGPNPNAPCDLRVYSLDGDYNLEQLLYEGRIDQLPPFDFDNMQDMWITVDFEPEDWIQFDQGEDFAIMYGPAPGGEYLPGEQGAGWWNLTDIDTQVNRSFIVEGDEPSDAHADWELIEYDLLLRARGLIIQADPPEMVTNPEDGDEIRVAMDVNDDPIERVITIGNDAPREANNLLFDIGIEEENFVRDRAVRNVRSIVDRFDNNGAFGTQVSVWDRVLHPTSLEENRNQKYSMQKVKSPDAPIKNDFGPLRDDPGDVVDQYDVPYMYTADLAWDGNLMWGACLNFNDQDVPEPVLIALDPDDGEIVEAFEIPEESARLTYDGNNFWIGNWGTETISIFGRNGRLVRTIDMAVFYPGGMACDQENYVFVSSWLDGDLTIHVIDQGNFREVAVMDYMQLTGDEAVGGLAWVPETPDSPLWALGSEHIFQFSVNRNLELDLEGSFEVASNGGSEGLGLANDGEFVWHGMWEEAFWVVLDAGMDSPSTWLSVEPDEGSVEPGDEVDVILTIDASDLEDGGVYDASVVISSNDPRNREAVIGVHLEVGGDQIPDLRHFNDFEITDINHNILILACTVEDEEIPTGWEIGVLTPNGLLAGGGVWVQGERLGLAAWGTEQNQNNGFAAGEAFNFRVWDDIEDFEYGGVVEWVDGPQVWQPNGFTVIRLEATMGRDLAFAMHEGWNMMSINVSPGEEFYIDDENRGPNVPLMMEQLRIDNDNHHVQLMKDELGHFFSPAWGFCNIVFWDLAQGYQVDLDDNVDVMWTGEPIPFNADVPIARGWNMIAYFPTYRLDVSAPDFYAVAGIVDHILTMKDEVGHFLSPAWNFSNMDPLREGKGYQINVDQAVVLNYPEAEGNLASIDPNQGDTHWTAPTVTSMNMSVLVQSVAGVELHSGDQIAAISTSGNLVGAGTVDAEGRCGIAVWGDELETEQVEGLLDKEAFTLQLWNSESGEEVGLSVGSLLEGNGLVYTTDAFTVLDVAITNLAPENFYLSSAYPNPFNAITRIAYGLPEAAQVSIRIFDLSGRVTATIANSEQAAGNYSITWNAKNQPSGVYVVRMEAAGFTGVSKVMLVK